MPPFEFHPPKSNYVSTIADLMQAPAQAESQARAVNAQAWSKAGQDIAANLGGMPARILDAQAQQTQNESARLELGEKKRGQTVRSAVSQVLKDTPKLSEDGVSVWDVAAISKSLADQGYGAEAGSIVKDLNEINGAFRAEAAAKLSTVQLGARKVMAAGNDPFMAGLFIDQLEQNGSISKDHAAKYREFVTADPANVAKLTASLAGDIKPVNVGENDTLVQPITGQVIARGNPKSPTEASLAAAAAAGDVDAGKALQLMKGNPTEASLAAAAANGDKPAGIALELLRKQRPQPQVQRTWAKDPQTGKVGMFTEAEIQAKGYTRPNDYEISAAMPAEYHDAIDRALLSVPKARREQAAQLINRQWQAGDVENVRSTIRQAAIEGENVDTQKAVEGRRVAIASLNDISGLLAEMKASGVDTNIGTGTIEDLARKLGSSTDPRLVEFGSRINQTLFTYRQALSGAAFSIGEAKAYADLYPSYRNTMPVNEALTKSLLAQMENSDRQFWEQKLGKGGAELVGAVRKPAAAKPPNALPPGATITRQPVAGRGAQPGAAAPAGAAPAQPAGLPPGVSISRGGR